ncbi:MAG: hypothetical protein MOB07_25710 [Acidobacteria bacterium]|nr:hypothetical protein [Acidobacteriota bacterium]
MSEETTGQTSDSETAADEQPYDWEKCTVRLSITFLPGDGGEGGRQIILGCNMHRDPPLIETIRETGLGTLPPMISGMLEELKRRLPQQAEIAESRRQTEAAAAEKLELQRRQTKEKIEAARQRSRAKYDRQSAPVPVQGSVQSETLFDLGASSPAEQTDTTEPAGAKQPSLFN